VATGARIRGCVARFALLGATLALCLAGLELGLRAFWDGFYLKESKGYAAPSATRGWMNRPGITAVYGEPEFRIEVTHNSRGFRGPEVPASKPPGKIRVLVLGDSFTYGIGVADDETFSARLAQLDPRLEVLNTGVNGYGTAQELLSLRDDGLALRPDLVLVAFFWNDVGNSYKRAFPRFELDGAELRWPEPQVAAAPEAPRRTRREWLRHSYAYRFLSDRLKLLGYGVKLALRIPIEESDFVREADREAAWRLEAALLRAIRDLAASAGARTALAVIPEQVQVEPDVPVIGLDPADYDVLGRLREICAALELPVIDLLPALRAAHEAERAALYYRKDRHLTARGHAVAARALHAEFERLGLLAPR
jgi:lysophospholipase L1-like esterase